MAGKTSVQFPSVADSPPRPDCPKAHSSYPTENKISSTEGK